MEYSLCENFHISHSNLFNIWQFMFNNESIWYMQVICHFFQVKLNLFTDLHMMRILSVEVRV